MKKFIMYLISILLGIIISIYIFIIWEPLKDDNISKEINNKILITSNLL